MSSLDKTLADVISARAKNKRRKQSRRSSVKSSLVGSNATPAAKPRTRDTTQAKAQPIAPPPSEKIIVSNLPADVNEAQIKELFSMQIGPTKEVALHYDHSGRSKGVASIVFVKKGDGTRAFRQYHNRLIDGS